MEKPLWRWTIGGEITPTIKQVFKYAVTCAKKIYKNEFDFVICHNNISSTKWLENLNIDLYDQEKYESTAKGSFLKICPPRLRKNCHEFIVDNDQIIYKKISEIDSFLQNKNEIIISEGAMRCYGIYDNEIPNIKINTGFIGLPPNYDFQKEIQKYIKKPKIEHSYFDEQGLITLVASKHNLKKIPIGKIKG